MKRRSTLDVKKWYLAGIFDGGGDEDGDGKFPPLERVASCRNFRRRHSSGTGTGTRTGSIRVEYLFTFFNARGGKKFLTDSQIVIPNVDVEKQIVMSEFFWQDGTPRHQGKKFSCWKAKEEVFGSNFSSRFATPAEERCFSGTGTKQGRRISDPVEVPPVRIRDFSVCLECHSSPSGSIPGDRIRRSAIRM